MKRVKKRTGLILLFFIFLYSWLNYSLISPPSPNEDVNSTDSFSSLNALDHLKEIAKEPHSGGTVAHAEVRDYILAHCEQYGLETELRVGTGLQTFRRFAVAGKTENILARLKGSGNGKAVLVMSHYDTQPNTPGASDDGIGVAAMLETIELLSKGPALQNDIIFLFTDQEETALLGAESFSNTYTGFDDIGMILNFESRGNAGVSFTFETSSENGWVVREFVKAVDKPFTNSLAYEVYRLIPNDSDFSVLKPKGISGLNSAFIDGYAYYHSMVDDVDNVNLDTFQHQGDLMFGMVQHFGNTDLSNTKSEDAIFFSPLGTSMIIYPMSWDWPFVIITILLFIGFFYFGFKKKRLKALHVLAGFSFYLLAIILSVGLMWVYQWIVLSIYPHYTNFYSSSFYNNSYYVLPILGIGILVFSGIFSRLIHKLSFESLFAGALIIPIILMVVAKLFVPTGAYIFYMPLMVTFITYSLFFYFNVEFDEQTSIYGLGQAIILLLPIGMWTLFVYTLFVVFSFIIPYASAFFLALFFPFLIPAHRLINETSKNIAMYLALGLMVIGLVGAHLNSNYTIERPLDSELAYVLDTQNQEAYWVSGHANLDEWNGQYITDQASKQVLPIFSGRSLWVNEASMTDQTKGTMEVVSDSMISGQRFVTTKILPASDTNSFDLSFPGGTTLRNVDSRSLELPVAQALRYHAPDSAGITITFTLPEHEALVFRLIERKLGLPQELLIHEKPDNIIYGPGSLSNTTQVIQDINLQ